MSKEKQKVFAEGFSFKRNDNAPDFVVGTVKVNVEDAKKYLDEYADDGWVNFQVKLSQKGNYYCEHDFWKPTKKREEVAVENEGGELPF